MNTGIKATYVDQSTFLINGDMTKIFTKYRKVRANCETDGYKYSQIYSSSYNGNQTSVILVDLVLTSNLKEVWYGSLSVGNNGALPVHNHQDDNYGGKINPSNLEQSNAADGDLLSWDSTSSEWETINSNSYITTTINNDSDHGSTAPHDYFSGGHDDLTNINPDDHHTKYTDKEAQDAIGEILVNQGKEINLIYDNINGKIYAKVTNLDFGTFL